MTLSQCHPAKKCAMKRDYSCFAFVCMLFSIWIKQLKSKTNQSQPGWQVSPNDAPTISLSNTIDDYFYFKSKPIKFAMLTVGDFFARSNATWCKSLSIEQVIDKLLRFFMSRRINVRKTLIETCSYWLKLSFKRLKALHAS